MKPRTPGGTCFIPASRAAQAAAAGCLIIVLAILGAGCGNSSNTAEGASSPTTAVASDTAVAQTATATHTPTPTPLPTATPTPEPIGLLDGVHMDQGDFTQRMEQRPIAVMIDNNPAAYPQAGLHLADVVIEGFVEGHITRYMAIYWRNDAPYIGPVRSVRTPFVHWAAELNVILATVGAANQAGEANAGSLLRNWAIPWLDHDEPIGPPIFYRTADRRVPHNVITSTTEIRNGAEELGRDPGDGAHTVAPWPFKEDGTGTSAAPQAHRIDVRFSSRLGGGGSGVHVGWVWDHAESHYLRYRSGAPHYDGADGTHLTATNVIVMHLTSRVVSPHGHLVYDQLGEGPATIYMDGKRIDATWRKTYPADRTRFYSAGGTEVALNRGTTWIAMISQLSTVTDSAQ